MSTTPAPLVRIGTIVRGHTGSPDETVAVHYELPTQRRAPRERYVGPVWRSTEPGQRPQYWASESDARATGSAVDQPERRELTTEESAAYARCFTAPDLRGVHVEAWDRDPVPVAQDLSGWDGDA